MDDGAIPEGASIIGWKHPEIHKLAKKFRHNAENVLKLMKYCMGWVQDEIAKSYDYRENPVACLASEVLKHRTE